MELSNTDNSEDVVASRRTSKDEEFDIVIGHIEDIIIDEKFQNVQKDFMDKHYRHFDDGEENKLEYTTIFKEYQDVLEQHLEKEICSRLPDFLMSDFVHLLRDKRKELEGEVFEMLLSLSDFLIFKELMLDYKKEKEGARLDLSSSFVVTSMSTLNISRK